MLSFIVSNNCIPIWSYRCEGFFHPALGVGHVPGLIRIDIGCTAPETSGVVTKVTSWQTKRAAQQPSVATYDNRFWPISVFPGQLKAWGRMAYVTHLEAKSLWPPPPRGGAFSSGGSSSWCAAMWTGSDVVPEKCCKQKILLLCGDCLNNLFTWRAWYCNGLEEWHGHDITSWSKLLSASSSSTVPQTALSWFISSSPFSGSDISASNVLGNLIPAAAQAKRVEIISATAQLRMSFAETPKTPNWAPIKCVVCWVQEVSVEEQHLY